MRVLRRFRLNRKRRGLERRLNDLKSWYGTKDQLKAMLETATDREREKINYVIGEIEDVDKGMSQLDQEN